MERIPLDEVRFHPHSFGDPDGRLFWWRGELYRGIRPQRVPFIEELFRSGVLRALIDARLLVETDATSLTLDGFALIVRHRELPFPSYPVEWPPAMLKEAALALVRLREALDRHGLTLKDTHPWNLVFDGTHPLFVDLTSIVRADGGPAFSEEKFRRYYLRPLALMAAGRDGLARALMLEYDGVQKADLPLRSRLSLLRKIDRLRIEESPPADAEQVPPEARSLLTKLRPASVLDLSGHRGAYALLAAQLGGRAVVLDTDRALLNGLFFRAREARAAILPLVMDFTKTTPSIGFSGHFLIAASERLRCELVSAPGLARRLVDTRSIPPELVAEGLDSFAGRLVLAEVGEGLEEALSRRFRRVERLGTLLLAER